VEFAAIAELQVVVEGVGLPATRAELVRYAETQGASPRQLGLLGGLPAEEFQTIDEIGEWLIRMQPECESPAPHQPREESGLPPGGDEYTNPSPVSGFVRE
jgi:hypothetical protein